MGLVKKGNQGGPKRDSLFARFKTSEAASCENPQAARSAGSLVAHKSSIRVENRIYNLRLPDPPHQLLTYLWASSGERTRLGVLRKRGSLYYLLIREGYESLCLCPFAISKASQECAIGRRLINPG